MNIKKELETKIGIANDVYLNNIEIDPLTIKAIMINEVVPADPAQDFYGSADADYLKTTIPLLLPYRMFCKWAFTSQTP